MAIKRNREISIRVSDTELEKMKKRQRGKTLAGWLRNVALGIVPPVQADADLIRQLGRIGSNLNQLARHVNTKRSVDQQVLNEVTAIRHLMHRLIDDNIAQAQLRNNNDS